MAAVTQITDLDSCSKRHSPGVHERAMDETQTQGEKMKKSLPVRFTAVFVHCLLSVHRLPVFPGRKERTP